MIENEAAVDSKLLSNKNEKVHEKEIPKKNEKECEQSFTSEYDALFGNDKTFDEIIAESMNIIKSNNLPVSIDRQASEDEKYLQELMGETELFEPEYKKESKKEEVAVRRDDTHFETKLSNVESDGLACDKCTFRTKCKVLSQAKQILKAHIKTVHQKIRDFLCPHCSSQFSQKGNLNQHIKKKHSDENNNSRTNKILPNKEDRNATQTSSGSNTEPKIKDEEDIVASILSEFNDYSKKKEAECDDDKVNDSPNAKSSLTNEQRNAEDKIVEGDDGVPCPKCDHRARGKTISSAKQNLKAHIKAVHDKVKDHQCPQCDYKTAQKCNLNTHLKKHH